MSARFYKKQMDELAFGIVPAYRRFELYYARFHELRPAIAPLLARGGEVRILDVGAGVGDAKKFIDPLGGRTRWTAVEGNPLRAEVCRTLGYSEVLVDLDLEHQPLPYADGSFEVVIASHVLEHLENAEAALRDWHRVLAPGGALLIGVPMHPAPLAALARLRYRIFGRKPRAHCHFFSLGSLRRFLDGYQVVDLWGFRLFSARRQLPLEDWEPFYRWSLKMGRRFPGLSGEVNVLITRQPAPLRLDGP